VGVSSFGETLHEDLVIIEFPYHRRRPRHAGALCVNLCAGAAPARALTVWWTCPGGQAQWPLGPARPSRGWFLLGRVGRASPVSWAAWPDSAEALDLIFNFFFNYENSLNSA
jgi:hypothetical protein